MDNIAVRWLLMEFCGAEVYVRYNDALLRWKSGEMYKKAEQVARNDDLAFECYFRAAAQGYAEAKFVVGGM